MHTVLIAFQEHSQEGLRGPLLCFPFRLFLKVIQAVLTEGAPQRQRLPTLPSRHHARSGCGVSFFSTSCPFPIWHPARGWSDTPK